MLKDLLSPRAYRQLQLAKLKHKYPPSLRYVKYRNDPVAYADEILKVSWWSKQKEIAELLLKPPYRVLVKASHSVGKTFMAGSLVNWWYDCYSPGLTLTTAPNDTQVKDLLWKEVRLQRGKRGGFAGPQVSRLEDSDNHWAHGFTAKDDNSFQGRHNEHMLFVFDEAIGVGGQFWTAAETMFAGEGHAWLAIFNPTDTGSQAYQESLSNKWHQISISMLDHPNIAAELAGLPPIYPAAIRLDRLNTLIREWCTPVGSDKKATDLEWPPGSGQWWRPGPLAESRILGRWPSQSTYNVWSDAAWQSTAIQQAIPKDVIPEVGCDVARYGCFDDQTEILTDRGWLLFDDLLGNEKVFTLNGDIAEWGDITHIHKYAFDGYLNLYDQERLNFCITDNHRLLVDVKWKDAGWHLAEYSSLPSEFVVKRVSDWVGVPIQQVRFVAEKDMPHGGQHIREWIFDPIDWCKFLGWYVSEGSCYQEKREGGRLRVLIGQRSNPEKLTAISDLLTRMGLKFRYEAGSFEFCNASIARHLIGHCGKGANYKRVPDYVKNATCEQIDAFLETFCMGDGTHRNGERLAYYTSSKLLADDLHEMLVKLGKSGKLKLKEAAGTEFFIGDRSVIRKVDTYVLNERAKKLDSYVYKKYMKKYRYTGFVYCVSTPKETIMVRRNGCTMWSGNSDYTEIHARVGPCSLYHESYNGWSTEQTAGRLKELTRELGKRFNCDPLSIPVKIDDSGVGGGVTDKAYDYVNGVEIIYNFVPVNSASKAFEPEKYPNRRSELWFATEDRAENGNLDLTRLDSTIQLELRRQAMAPYWKLNGSGQRVVEPKEDTKKRLGRSPDGLDSINLAFSGYTQALL